MKRLVCVFIAIVLCSMMLCPSIVFAESNIEYVVGQEYQYSVLTFTILEDGTAMITDCKDVSGAIEIPEKIDTVTVSTIGNEAFKECKNIVSISLPDTVTSIGDGAFDTCESLVSVKLPKGLLAIGKKTFYNCKRLTVIEIPDTVVSIGEGAFKECRSLSSVSLPDGITILSNEIFDYCSNLVTVDLPESLVSIGQRAFRHCDNLTSITLPDTLLALGNGSFSSSGLTHIVIPEGITYLGSDTFYANYSLIDVVLPSTLQAIDAQAFLSTSLVSINIPDGVQSIGRNAFKDCSKLHEVSIPASVKDIEASAFNGCKNAIFNVEEGSYAEAYLMEAGIENFANNPTVDAGPIVIEVSQDVVVVSTPESTSTQTPKPTATPTPEPTATPKPTPEPIEYTMLKKGDSGMEVYKMKKKLVQYGYLKNGNDDKFDVDTEQAVIAFNKQNFGEESKVADERMQELLFEGVPKKAEATPEPTVTPTPKPIARETVDLVPGMRIAYGEYKQGTSSSAKEPIVWRVLDVVDQKALVISEKALDARAYGAAMDIDAYTQKGLCWKNSDLNKWLNDGFMNAAFTDVEDSAIVATENTTSDAYGTNTSTDKVFCLSIEEVNKYFTNGKDMASKPTQYAYSKLKKDAGATDSEGYGLWWLRDMIKAEKGGEEHNEAAAINLTSGTSNKSKMAVPVFCDYLVCVRPAMRLDLTQIPVGSLKIVEDAQYETIQSGSKGDAVSKLQSRLNELGYSAGTADGIYGNKTKVAIQEFQTRNNLPITGIADEDTQKVLYSSKALKPTATPKPTAKPTPKPTKKPSSSSSSSSSAGLLSGSQCKNIALAYLYARCPGAYVMLSDAAVDGNNCVVAVQYSYNGSMRINAIVVDRRSGSVVYVQ